MRARTAGSIRRLCLIVLPLLACAAAPLSGLEAADGRVRLTLNEGSGRFSISCQTQGSNSVSLPLLAAQDPRTTVLSIVVGNKLYRMGESSEFSQKAEKIPGGARYIWKSSFLQCSETFTFLHSLDSSVSTGVRIDLSLKNFSERDITAGARYLFDTYLGEPASVHFRTSLLGQINRELSISPVGTTAWWLSPLAGDKDQFGLQVITSGNGITVPDRLVFANWKRLSDSNWAFETSAARDFNLLPYSVNDSAVAQYYEPRSIPRSGEVTITLALGLYSAAGYDVNSVVPVASTSGQELPAGVQKSLAEGQNAADTAHAAHADLSAVNAILSAIDAKIDTSASVSEDEISMIESALKVLKDRSNRFALPPESEAGLTMKGKSLGEARRLFRARRFPDVIRLLEPEVFRYRESFEYFQMLGFSCLHAGDLGGAFSYISRAHQLKDDDPGVLLGLAAVHFRRAENESALKKWLEVVESHPANPIARRGLELLRKGMTPDALQEFIDSGRLKTLFPPLPRRFSIAPILIIVLSALVLAGAAWMVVHFGSPRGPQRPGVSVIEIPSNLSSFIDVGIDFPFVLSEKEVRQVFQKAKNELLGYRDNLAVVDINRILLSNAAPAVKERARMLKGFVTQATFDTIKNGYPYAAVAKQPALYDGASVVWRGKVANLKVGKESLSFDLLVGYDQEKQLEGIVAVTVPFAADLADGSGVEVLGQVVVLGTAPGLTAGSLHRLTQ